MTVPVFAVVGRPNKGKSSIVATLARDDSVYIAPQAGSTREARRFPMQVNGEVLYELVDTPGIQRARSVLSWLQEHNADAASRPDTVRRFIADMAGDDHYRDECEALAPIMAGAGIIYVVDGSHPFGADYEAEMEVLRWTGRPSLALINPIENDDYVSQWTVGLGQYFTTVRTFNAHRAELRKQLDLLALFGHLDPGWQSSLQRAVQVLEEDRLLQHRSASFLICDMIVDALEYRTEQSLPEGVPAEPVQKLLRARYKSHLVKRERQCRKQVEEAFYYDDLQKDEAEIAFEDEDLFNEEQWYLWGLSRRQLVVAAASAGGIAGGGAGMVIDAATGGLLGGLGTAVTGMGGAISSAVGAIKYADEIAQIKVSGLPSGGKHLSYGPARNINFPFVLLGRALTHHRLVSMRTHAVRDKLEIQQPVLDWMTDAQRRKLARCFADLRAGKKMTERRSELAENVLAWCVAVDNPSASESSEGAV
tara:strand:+ start:96498 stop:97931 length:1434 start_codon:yes stop_codon:yes gene_type:complete